MLYLNSLKCFRNNITDQIINLHTGASFLFGISKYSSVVDYKIENQMKKMMKLIKITTCYDNNVKLNTNPLLQFQGLTFFQYTNLSRNQTKSGNWNYWLSTKFFFPDFSPDCVQMMKTLPMRSLKGNRWSLFRMEVTDRLEQALHGMQKKKDDDDLVWLTLRVYQSQ